MICNFGRHRGRTPWCRNECEIRVDEHQRGRPGGQRNRGHAAICAAHPPIVMDFKTDKK